MREIVKLYNADDLENIATSLSTVDASFSLCQKQQRNLLWKLHSHLTQIGKWYFTLQCDHAFRQKPLQMT